jgi:CheY-like chemotaxis protein
MLGKRALIVDDSRSARVILGRMLESFGLQTDSAESAEQAFEYLQTARPDVIFMDHLMPGMDGFAAVKLLKANPDTATIPVLMYTSQEGELYMGQARALGAVGVLPKTVKPVDLTRLLHQLHLLPDRRQELPPVEVATLATGTQAAVKPRSAAVDAEVPGQSLHDAELRLYISNGFEALARRIASDFKAIMSAAPLPAETAPPPVVSAAGERPRTWPLWTAACVFVVAVIGLFVYLNQQMLTSLRSLSNVNTQLAAQVANQQQQLTELQTLLRNSQRVAAAAPEPAPQNNLLQTELVPYGEAPLSGVRLERLRNLVDRLRAENAKGALRIETYAGDFCLSGSGAEGYSEAADDVSVRRCDIIGNPFDDSLSNAQRQSVAFANYLGTIQRLSSGALRAEVQNGGRRPAQAYPPQSETLTAGEWNRIAARNNRVEFSLIPAE